MTESKFLALVPWERAGAGREEPRHIRIDGTLCPIDAAGGRWGMADGNLGLSKKLHDAIITAADVPLAEQERTLKHYDEQVAKGWNRHLAGWYDFKRDTLAYAMRLRILFRVRMSEARDRK